MSGLVARLTELINATTDRPDRPHTAHGNHGFYAFCAICSGMADEIAVALAPGVERLLAEQAERIAKAIESEAIGEEGDPVYTNRRGTLGIAAEIARRFKP